jgi:hypothetical protein
MKYLTVFFILVLLLTASSPHKASAIFCANCSTVALQIPQLGYDTVSSGANILTQINTFLVQNKTLILDPLQNAMIALSLLNQQKNTLNLVMGSLGGSQPLFQSNPDQWIKNQGLNAVRVNISDVSAANGLFSGSILNSLVGSYRASSDLSTQLKSLSGSSIPNIVQNNACKDANLTAIARNDVLASTGATDQAAIITRKNQLWSSLCVGNPQSDPTLASRLAQIQTQRPDIAGDAALYAYLSGDNAYARSVRSAVLVEKDKEKKEEAAKSDLNRGGGIVSPSNCKQPATIDTANDIGTIANAPCRIKDLTNSSAAVSSQLQQALNSKMQKTITSEGWGILNTLGSLISGGLQLAQLASSVTGAVGGSSGSGGGTNTSQTTGSASAPAQDLNSASKAPLVETINTRITSYSTGLDKLQTADNNLSSQLTLAENYVNQMKSCYQGLVNDFDLASNDSRVAPAFSYYQTQMTDYASQRAKISGDQSGIAGAKTAISSLQNTLSSSNSREEINTAYEQFDEKIANGTLVSETVYVLRDADYQKLKAQNQLSTIEGGDLYNLNAQCAQLRQQLTPFQSN